MYKRQVLELGGNAACIVDEDADISDAIDRIIVGAYYQSGQSCISVQRLLVHSAIYDEFKSRYVERVEALVSGDPSDEDTFIGPMISEGEAKRLEGWIKDAKEAGASVLCGGERDGAMLQATVMENVPKDCDASAEEAFGPLSILQPFDDYDSALEEVNNLSLIHI